MKPIRYTIVPKQPAAHLFEVTVTVADPDPAGQRFMLPVWIPGSYMVREFARNIVTLRAFNDAGRKVRVEKTDKHTWQVAPVKGALTLRYEVYAWDLSVRAATSEVTLVADVQAATVHADPDLIHRVLVNLIENAIRHAPEGSRVRIAVAPSGGGVELSVADAGPGVPADQRTTRVAQIAGHGLVSDAVIAGLVDRAKIALLVTHPVTGVPLWYGRTRRLATPAQRAAVVAVSNGHCAFPGCTIPASRGEVDHRHGWTTGGPTDIDNLLLICPFHNRLKHRWNLRVERERDGTYRWLHPDGTQIASRYRTTNRPPHHHGPPGDPGGEATVDEDSTGEDPNASAAPDPEPDDPV